MQNNSSLKDLMQLWVNEKAPKVNYFQVLEDTWKNICPQNKNINIAEIISETSELVIEVNDHLLLCNLKFEEKNFFNKMNESLSKNGHKTINKLRFRLKRAL